MFRRVIPAVQLAHHGRFGCPWHGYWRRDYVNDFTRGAVHLPNGQTIDFPYCATAFLSIREGAEGTAWLVKVPGMPEVTPSPAEVAAGKSWPNYGLVSSMGGMLHGRVYGAELIVYVDPNKVRWVMGGSIEIIHLSDLVELRTHATRFAHISGRTPQTMPTKTLQVAYHMPNAAEFWMQACAVKSDGSEAIWAAMGDGPIGWYGNANAIDFVKFGQNWPTAFFRLRISGTGDEALPDFGLSFTFEKLWDRADAGAGGFTASNRELLWPVYDQADTLHWLNAWGAAPNVGTIALDDTIMWTGATSVNPPTSTREFYVELDPSHAEVRQWWVPVRYSDQLFGIWRGRTEWSPANTVTQNRRNVVEAFLTDAWAPGAHESFEVQIPYGGSPIHPQALPMRYGTWHPVTGEIRIDTVPVAWV